MNALESMKHIETSLDGLYNLGDDVLIDVENDALRQDIATLNYLLIHAKELAEDIAEELKFDGLDDDVIDGEFEDSSLDDSAEGEWR